MKQVSPGISLDQFDISMHLEIEITEDQNGLYRLLAKVANLELFSRLILLIYV